MIKVGERYTKEHKRKFIYDMMKTDPGGWVSPDDYMPINYDLQFVKIEGKPGTYSAWFTGSVWDGPHIKKGDKVIYWKYRDVRTQYG